MAKPAIETIAKQVLSYSPDADLALLRAAHEFAAAAHRGQQRDSGEDYIAHPLGVAMILAQLQLDVETVAAGILHDVLEDTAIQKEELTQRFGAEVARLVDGVTKLSRLPYQSKEQQQAENLRKMFLAMAEDLRVILIKLADRLHNMRTLRPLPPERQKKIAQETLEIYTPLAHRLGMWLIKWELEDLAFRYLEPEEYYRLVQKVARKRKEREGYINQVVETIRQKLAEMGIKGEVTGRPKHLFSIYNKMREQGKEFDEIYDLMGVRVIVDSVRDCYAVLGLVHALWKPIPGRFKDYIAMPKSNLYQSLHTTVVGPNGEPLEIQIRTWEMHRTAEYGIAAHWRYKEGRPGDRDFEEKISWLRQLLDWQREAKDPQDFLEDLKIDLFEDEVFVFTPKGDVKTLPAGSTPVDFAYSVHTDVGHHCVGAEVNGHIVPLNYRLKNGEFVEILTSKAGTPSLDWLSFVKTSRARNKIRQWHKERRRGETVAHGKALLEKEAQKYHLDPEEVLRLERLQEVARRSGLASPEDLLASVGFGRTTVHQVLVRLVGEATLEAQKRQIQAERHQVAQPGRPPRRDLGVAVKGADNLLIRMARCCSPVPGDPIVGYITRGRGVSVHRADCPNIAGLMEEGDRRLEVEWKNSGAQNSYPVEIEVEAIDRANLLANIMNKISELKADVEAVNARTTRDRRAVINLVVEINDVEHMNKVMQRLEKVEGVLSVYRASPT